MVGSAAPLTQDLSGFVKAAIVEKHARDADGSLVGFVQWWW